MSFNVRKAARQYPGKTHRSDERHSFVVCGQRLISDAPHRESCMVDAVARQVAAPGTRRVSPELIVASGCLIALFAFGPRATAGLFQIPMTQTHGWGRDIFGFAIALQNLLWG